MLAINLMRAGVLMLLVKSLNSTNNTFRKSRSRKIIDGKPVEEAVGYMVYLTKAEISKTLYDAWICGGAIVSKDFIVTSAACVEDVEYMYAISGYSKYVNVQNIPTNQCTKASKKKIVFICVPKRYDFAYDKIQKWAFIDIAAVKVESPYDFSAPVLPGCTWKPRKIDINYEARYQVPDTDAIVLGWGHVKQWRSPNDPKDYNQEDLQYSSIRTMNKAKCKEMYSKTPELIPIIEKYMICAMYEGNLDIKGDPKKEITSNADGCPPDLLRDGINCEQPFEKKEKENSHVETGYKQVYQAPHSIRPTIYGYQNQNKKPQNDHQNHTKIYYVSRPSVTEDQITFEDIILRVRRSDGNGTGTLNYTRKAGICQNDHGGPLVTWVGMRERLIGVASVFRLDSKLSCVGPYLFTSTQCNGGFLDCIINGNEESKDKLSSHQNDKKILNDQNAQNGKVNLGNRNIAVKLHVEGESDLQNTVTLINGEINVNGEKIPCNFTFVENKYIYKCGDGKTYHVSDEETSNKQTTRTAQRREYCDLPPEKKGFDVIKRRISWNNHPDGPAQNEIPFDLFERPVKPIG